MTKQTILQSFSLLILLIVLAPSAYSISEVTGILSSTDTVSSKAMSSGNKITLSYFEKSIDNPSSEVAQNDISEETTPVDLEDSSGQIAQAFVPAEEAGMGIGTWLLLLLLVLAVIAAISYFYNRSLDDRTTRLP